MRPPMQCRLAMWFVPLFACATSSADVLDTLTKPVPGRLLRASSGLFDPESNLDFFRFRPGQRRVVADLQGPGEIRHLWMTMWSRDRRYPRKVVMRIYYDDAKHPSVETPIGDFFAAGNGMRANITSKPVEVSSYGRALNCYWRMPFKKRCRVEFENQSSESVGIYFHGDWMKLPALDDDVRYFHARYRQEYPARPFEWYTVFEGEGEGHYVGTVFSSQNNLGGWFGETDDRFYVDGEVEPSIVGTGTEDYFNDAWNLRVTNHQRVGTTICEPRDEQRRITAYRWHLDDPIPFSKSLKFELERRSYVVVRHPESGRYVEHDFKYRPDDWSSVAFWYQKGVAEPLWDFPPVEQRVQEEEWIEPAWIVDQATHSPGLEPRRKSNRTCNLKKCFYMRNDEPGSWVEFPLTIRSRGRYAASVFVNLNEERGVWRVTLHGDGDERQLAKGLDCYDHYLPLAEDWPENFQYGTTREIKLGCHHLQPGEYRVRFECVGANPQSRHPETGEFGQGMSLCLDAVNFRKLRIEDPQAWLDQYLADEAVHVAKQVAQAEQHVAALAAAVEKHHQRHGDYPAKLDDLEVPSAGIDPAALDPWHQPYQYRVPGIVRPQTFDVWSYHGNSRRPVEWIGNWPMPFERSKLADEGVVVIEGEQLDVRATSKTGFRTVQQSGIRTHRDAPISGEELVFVRFQKPGDWVEFTLPGDLAPGRYEVTAVLVTAADYGQARWALGPRSDSRVLDAYSETLGVKTQALGTVEIGTERPVLRIEAVGKHERSVGYAAGIDALLLRRMPAK